MPEPQVPLSHLEAMVERILKRILKPVLVDILLESDNQSGPSTVPIAEAAKILGYPSPQAVYKDISGGLLRVGHEVEDRRRPGREKPRYYINIEAAKQRLRSDPARRRIT